MHIFSLAVGLAQTSAGYLLETHFNSLHWDLHIAQPSEVVCTAHTRFELALMRF